MKLIITGLLLTLSLFAENDRYCYERNTDSDNERIVFCISPSKINKSAQASWIGFSRYFTLDVNFELTKEDEKQIREIHGVDDLYKVSRYSYTVCAGKLFDTYWVIRDVLKYLTPVMHTKILGGK